MSIASTRWVKTLTTRPPVSNRSPGSWLCATRIRRWRVGKSTGASGSRALGFVAIGRCSGREMADVGQLAVALAAVDTVADDELVGHGEAEIIDLDGSR